MSGGGVTIDCDGVTLLPSSGSGGSGGLYDPVLVSTTANLNATYDNGTSGLGATLTNAGANAAFSVDGVSPSANARILVKNQSTTTQNGIYTLTTVGDGATPWVLTRSTDFDSSAEISQGEFVLVTTGTVNAGTFWYVSSASAPVIGTDAITFSESGVGTFVTSGAVLTDNAIVRGDGGARGVQTSGIIIADTTNDVSGIGSITPVAGSAFRTASSAGNTLLLQARDVDGAAYSTFATLTANNNPALAIAAPAGGTVTIDGASIGSIAAGSGAFTTVSATGQITSTLATGTAPFVVASTTQVANLNVATSGSATNATNAANTAITDDTTTNGTMYPTWVTAATGNLPQEVSSTKLTFNPSTGLLSSTALASGVATLTTASANALIVGPSGASNPTLQIDASAATAITGIAITAGAAGTPPNIATLSTNGSEGIDISSKGSGNVRLRRGTTALLTLASSTAAFTPGTSTTATNIRFGFTGAADTTLTASTEAPDVYFNMGQTRQHSAGALTLQRDMRVTGSTHSADGATTITNAASLSVDGPPIGGTNVTITNSHGVYVPTLALSNVTNGFGLTVEAPSGAGTLNAAAQFTGTVNVTATSANALTVGRTGSTNPALKVITSTASSVTGVSITADTSGNSVATIAAISSGSDCDLTINTKGSNGVLHLQTAGSGNVSIEPGGLGRGSITQSTTTFSTNNLVFNSTTSSSAATIRFGYTGAADTALTAATNAVNVKFNLSQTREHASNTTVALQQDFLILGSVHAFASSGGTITDCAALSIDGPDSAGTNATITNSHGIYVPTKALAGTVTNGYGISVAAPSGAGTLNAAANFTGNLLVSGDAKLGTAGNGLYVKEGTNATMGVATLVGGTVVVNTTKVTANSRIFLTAQSLGTVTVGQGLAISARTAATSFTILSTSPTDTSVVAWMIFEPA